MLGSKIPEVNIRSPRITGIAGAGRSVGTTHLAIWSANYLASCRQKRTAVVEWSSHSDFIRLRLDAQNLQRARAFCLLGVDYYPKGEKEALAACIRSGYEEILIDFGPMRQEIRAEWYRCQVRFLTASLSEWKLETFLGFLAQEEGLGEGWSCMAAFGSETIRQEIEKQFRIPVERIPFAKDVFQVDKTAMAWLGKRFP